MSLLNRGIIPRDVDLTPAFERGAPPIAFKPADLHPKEEERRARLQPMPALPYRAPGPYPQHPHAQQTFITSEKYEEMMAQQQQLGR